MSRLPLGQQPIRTSGIGTKRTKLVVRVRSATDPYRTLAVAYASRTAPLIGIFLLKLFFTWVITLSCGDRAVASTIMVFSHPNHEVAVLGTVFRLRPHIIYLTDGGGEARVDQTRQALQDYQPASVHYLNHPEQSLYDALLVGDAEFYGALASEVGNVIAKLGADIVYCDAVEFYNPVHDIALPVVRAALGTNDVSILETPLIYQKAGSVETFELQHVPPSFSSRKICIALTQKELDQKTTTIESGVYRLLLEQLGGAILDALPSRGGHENFLKARSDLPSPCPEQVLRYEMRGKLLKDAGALSEVITFNTHYAPIFEALCGGH
jgi:hypothetical protein